MVGKRICVLDKENLKFKLLDEAPRTPYSVHPRAAKMYQDLMQHYQWHGMKRDVIAYVEQRLTYKQVKAEHQPPQTLSLVYPERTKTITLFVQQQIA